MTDFTIANVQVIHYCPDGNDLALRLGEGITAMVNIPDMRSFLLARDLSELSASFARARTNNEVTLIMLIINAHGDSISGNLTGEMLGSKFCVTPQIFMNGLVNIPVGGTSPFTGLNHIFSDIDKKLIVVSAQCFGTPFSDAMEGLSTLQEENVAFTGLSAGATYSAAAGMKDYLKARHVELTNYFNNLSDTLNSGSFAFADLF